MGSPHLKVNDDLLGTCLMWLLVTLSVLAFGPLTDQIDQVMTPVDNPARGVVQGRVSSSGDTIPCCTGIQGSKQRETGQP